MNVSEISGTNAYGINKNSEEPMSLKDAIKAYRDEKLTGLTDEEIEEIEKEARLYLQQFPIKTDADRAAFNTFIKSLLKKFGYKGDIDEYAASIAANAEASGENGQAGTDGQASVAEPAKLFQRESLGSAGIKNKFLS